MNLKIETSFEEPSGLHSPTWFATEEEYCLILTWLIKSKKYKSILELGTFMGHSTAWFLDSIKDNKGNVVTVDKEQKLLYRDIPNLKAINSTTDDFFNNNDDCFDFIYVDAWHGYEQAKKDIINSYKCLNKGGSIGVHDTGYDNPPVIEVAKAVREVAKEIGGRWIHLKQGEGLSIGQF